MRCRFEEYAEAAEQAVRHARLAGREPGNDFGFTNALRHGPRPASEAPASLDRLLPGSQRPIVLLTGRFDEAETLARQGRELGAPEDLYTQARWRQVQALVLSSRCEHAEAEQLARDAVTISEGGDILELQGDTHADLAEVLETGRSEAAAAALREALDRYDRKEILPLARRTRERLATLGGANT